jgi:hypothetical protein
MSKNISKFKLSCTITIITVLFTLGLTFIITNRPKSIKEYFSNRKYKCPNILIQKHNVIYLYNSKLAKIPGVNPIKFNNLEDYVEYVTWQRHEGINCPILFLQHTYDTQGESVYKVRPSPTNLQGGLDADAPIDVPSQRKITKLLDAARNDPPYNNNSYPGFDPLNLYIGEYTPLDKLFHQNPQGKSPNPMDPNWGGGNFTQSLIDQGYYKQDEVFKVSGTYKTHPQQVSQTSISSSTPAPSPKYSNQHPPPSNYSSQNNNNIENKGESSSDYISELSKETRKENPKNKNKNKNKKSDSKTQSIDNSTSHAVVTQTHSYYGN